MRAGSIMQLFCSWRNRAEGVLPKTTQADGHRGSICLSGPKAWVACLLSHPLSLHPTSTFCRCYQRNIQEWGLEQLLLFTSLSVGGFEGGQDTRQSLLHLPEPVPDSKPCRMKSKYFESSSGVRGLRKACGGESLLMFLICFEKWGFSYLLYSEFWVRRSYLGFLRIVSLLECSIFWQHVINACQSFFFFP